ncbi:ABC transporter substrate-binding protein [Thermodesulfobacteriota bacterium]
MAIAKILGRGIWVVVGLAVLGLLMTPQISDAKNKIRIAYLAPMKASGGLAAWQGAAVTAEEINEKGGINVGGVRHEIEMVPIDTNEFASMPDAVNAMERACTIEKVDFVMGGYRNEAMLAMMDIAMQHKKILIDTGSSKMDQLQRVKKNYKRYKYYFRTSQTMAPVAAHMFADADYVGNVIRKQLGIAKPKVAIVMDKLSFADGAAKLAGATFPKMGYEVVGTWRTKFTASDLFVEANAIHAAGAHMIFVLMVGPGGSAFVNAWQKIKIPAALVGSVTASQTLKYWKNSGGAANYLAGYDTIGRVKMSERTLTFYDRYLKKWGDKPGYISPLAEGGVLILKQAIEKAGTLDADKLVPALEKANVVYSRGRMEFYPLDSDMPHQVKQCMRGYSSMVSYQWREGKQNIYFPSGGKVHPAILAFRPAAEMYSGLRFEGTGEYKLPPWMVKHYKK